MTDKNEKPEDRELFVIEHAKHGKRLSDKWSLARKPAGWKKSETTVAQFREQIEKSKAETKKTAAKKS